MVRFTSFRLGLVLVLVACIGCRAALPPGSSPLATATTLTIEATPLDRGEVALSGTTSLPDNTQLTAIALRYLDPADSTLTVADRDTLYAVLDYEPVTVTNGQWSTQLTLWQTAVDGRYQEPWQAQAESLNLALQPRETVQFAIALAPHHLGSALHHAIAHTGPQPLASLLRMTPSGEPYLWADQSLPVGLPRGQTAPPPDLLARTNGGWGDRYLLVPEPPLPYTLTPADQRQTTAPLTPGEMLR